MRNEKGQFIKGERISKNTEFIRGSIPWNKGIKTGISLVNKKDAVFLSCKNCKNIFTVQPYRKDTALFCCRSCAVKFKIKVKGHHMWKGGKPHCLKCNKTLSNYTNTHCNSCKGMIGDKNHKWINDRSLIQGRHNRALHDSDYKIWRKNVCNRDNWKCKINNEDCKGRLEVHHILSWKEYPELRYITSNGITLCHYHHPKRRDEEKKLSPFFQDLINIKS